MMKAIYSESRINIFFLNAAKQNSNFPASDMQQKLFLQLEAFFINICNLPGTYDQEII